MNAVLALALVACSAAPNPRRPASPSPWTPPAESASSAPASQPSPAPAPPAPAGASDPVPAPASSGAPAQDRGATAPSAPARPGAAPAGVPIANVAGEALDIRELVAQWVHHKSADALDELDHLVLTRLVRAEAARLGVELPPESAQKAYEAAVAQMEKEIQKRRPGLALDAWVDQVLGLDPLVYRERMRSEALQQLLAERTTRAYILQSEHAELRLIVLRSEAEVKDAQAALAKGEAFEEVAKRLSADPSSKEGGRVPPVIRADTPVARLAFQTAVGGVSEPLYNEGAWLIAKVEARPAPIEGNWSKIRETVEASLAARGIEELEFTQWRASMLRRYQVDISPFLRLAGQPVR